MRIDSEILYTGTLNPVSIDETSEAAAKYYASLSLASREILKRRLCIEAVMGIWAEVLGEDTTCSLVIRRHLGHSTLVLQAEGISVDPTGYKDDLLLSVSSNPNFTAALGLPAEYHYTGGKNELILSLPAKKANPVQTVLAALLAALILGFGLRLIAPGIGAVLAEQVFEPLTSTITNMLRLIAGPLVFLSVVSGINGVGDASAFGRIGGTLTKRFLLMTLLVTTLMWAVLLPFFPLTLTGTTEGDSAFSDLVSIILGIVPSDIVTPFQTGNAMQIIFMAACVGIGGILIGESVTDGIKVANQLNAIVQRLMTIISRLLPAYIFLCISELIITSDLTQLSQVLVPVAIIYALCLLTMVVYGLYASFRTGFSYSELLKAQLSTFITAVTTASSAAAFSVNVDCCEKELGIDKQLVRFGIPFGQVLFMFGASAAFLGMALYAAKTNGIAMTPGWVLTLIIVVSVLSVAAPPIPGGALSCVIVLFSQLGIPMNDMAICAAVIAFSDYICTACNIVCLQQELLISAKKLNLQNRKSMGAM